jgi:hypothetical protein
MLLAEAKVRRFAPATGTRARRSALAAFIESDGRSHWLRLGDWQSWLTHAHSLGGRSAATILFTVSVSFGKSSSLGTSNVA